MASAYDELAEQPFDPLLGQQRMVADPRISAAQAATVLGKTVEHVHRLMALGRLPTHGPPNTFWQLRLSDVERLRDRGEPIPLKKAARLLRCITDDVRKLIADGKLTAVPDARRPVYLLEVQALAAATDLPPRPPHPQPPPEGHVNTRDAAKILGRSISRTRNLPQRAGSPLSQTRTETTGTNPTNSRWCGAPGSSPKPTTAAKPSNSGTRRAIRPGTGRMWRPADRFVIDNPGWGVASTDRSVCWRGCRSTSCWGVGSSRGR